MACDGYLVGEGSKLTPSESSRIWFGDDGYYWFLHPFFEAVNKQTGQMIDLYADADFHEEALVKLSEAMQSARSRVLEQPETWEVEVGEQLQPVRKKLVQCVARQDFLGLLDTFLRLIQEASATGRHLHFIGD